jgi:light-regulated signal transduction histidine kinase (bacteriophytochrome)
VGRQKLRPEPVDCNAIVQKVLRDLRVAISESHATLNVEPLPTLQADPTQIALLFQNLIGNAIKYRSETPPQIQIRASKAAEQWRFSVRDNGIGIEVTHQRRISGNRIRIGHLSKNRGESWGTHLGGVEI